MRILYITHAYPPLSTGGTELSTQAMAQRMQAAGHDVRVLCAGKWGAGERYWNGESRDVVDGIAVTRLQINWSLASDPNRYLYDNPHVAVYLEGYLAAYQPDVVHVTSCVTLSSSVISTSLASSYPTLVTLTDFWFICPQIQLIKGSRALCDGHVAPGECIECMLWDTRTYRWPRKVLPKAAVRRMLELVAQRPGLTRRAGLRGMAFDVVERRKVLQHRLAACDRIIVKSEYVRRVFQAHGVPTGLLTVLPDGDDTRWGAQAVRSRTKEAGNPVASETSATTPESSLPRTLRIGYLGHIVHSKGVHVLLQAFKGLPPSAELRIYGDNQHAPDYSTWLQQLSAEDSRISFCGKYTHEQLAEIMSALDVVVVPSIWPETFNHVIREAFIAGIPVVASDIGAIPEIVQNEVNGLLFPAGDSPALQHCLQRLLEQPELLEHLSANIPAVKSIEQHSQELESLYQQVLQSRTSLSRQTGGTA